jgi:hypothetical protein
MPAEDGLPAIELDTSLPFLATLPSLKSKIRQDVVVIRTDDPAFLNLHDALSPARLTVNNPRRASAV